MTATKQKQLRVIKRYRNRKLYDMLDSAYVTLEDIGDLIKAGEEVQVIDDKNGSDITGMTFAQILFEEERKKKSTLPLETLKGLVQMSGNAIKGFVEKSLGERGEYIREELGSLFDKYVNKGQLTTDAKRSILDSVAGFIEDRIKPAIDQAQKKPDVEHDIRSLRAKIDELEKKLRE